MKRKRVFIVIFTVMISLGFLTAPAFARERMIYSPDHKLPVRTATILPNEVSPQPATGSETSFLQNATNHVGDLFKAVEGAAATPYHERNRTGNRFGFPGQK